MKKEQVKPDARLSAAIPFVRQGHTVADVGTDHAYLPIALVQSGRVPRAIASDVNEGPVERANQHIFAAGLSDKITTVRTDGLHGLAQYRPQDILIFGMGGDLTVRILDEAKWIFAPEIRLILQPMTHADTVRRYLAASGFAVTDETLVPMERRIYQIICADYTGEVYPCSDTQAVLGKCNIARGGECLHELARRELRAVTVKRDGKRVAGENIEKEEILMKALEEYV